MKSADSSAVIESFREFLHEVEQGETIRITRDGRSVARLIPDRDFMSGREAAELFRRHAPTALDRAAADSIAEKIAELDRESEDALAH